MAALALLFAFVMGLLAYVAMGLRRSEVVVVRAAPGSVSGVVADLVGRTPTDEAIEIRVAGTDRPTLLAFLTSTCTTCAEFWNVFGDVERLSIPGRPQVVIVTKGMEVENASRLRKLASPNVPVVMTNESWTTYGVAVAPYFIYVDGPSGGIVGGGAAGSWPELRSMLVRALSETLPS